MTSPARAQLTAVGSGRTVAITEAGLAFGGPAADIPWEGAGGPIAFLDPIDEGFVITDVGDACTVNGRPVIGQRLAQLGDLIRVSGEGYLLEPFEAVPLVDPPVDPPVVHETPEAREAPEAPEVRETPEAPEPPAAHEPPNPSSLPVLARLEVLGSGLLAGRTFSLLTRLTLVGRGTHNDVVLEDDTVSDSHAKIVRRGKRWFVLDDASANGTYVAGRRIDEEHGLAAGSEVRFGGIKVRFEPVEGDGNEVGGKGRTRQVVARPMPVAAEPAAEVAPAPVAEVVVAPPAPPAARSSAWRSALGWIVVTVVVVASGVAGYLVAAMLRAGR